MKNFNFLRNLFSPAAGWQSKDVRMTLGGASNEHPFSIHSASVGTRWKPAGKMQKVMSRLAAVVCLLVTLGVGNAWGAVTALTIPKSWGASDGKSAYTDALGCTKSGLGSDYSSSPKLKFDDQGDYMIIQLASSPAYVTFNIKGSASNWTGTFKVQESDKGSTYTDAASYTSLSNSSTSKTVALKASTRYIKFIFASKTTGFNVGLGGVTIKARTTVTLDKNGGGSDGSAVVLYNATSTESLTAATRAGYTCTGYWTATSSGNKIINADGTLNATSVSNWLSSGKWVKDAAIATLYAQWESAATINVTGVTVSPTSKSIIPGETFTITPTVAPANATDKSVSWTSSATSKATVTSAGVVTGVAAGSSTITCTTTDGSYTATCAVTVRGVTLQALDEDGNAIGVGGPSAPTRSGTTITAAADAGNYVFKQWDITNATAASTTTSPTTLSNPTGAVTVTAVYYKPITITYKANGSNFTTQTYARGGTLAFPASNPDGATYSCTGKTFVGWVAEANKDYSHASTPPTYATAGGSVTAAANYYAVFATSSGSGSGSITLSYGSTSLNLGTSYESGTTKTVSDINFYCKDICTGNSGSDGYQKIQFKKSSTGPGYIYNSGILPGNITSIVFGSTTRDMTVNFGTSSNPDGSSETTTCSSSSLTATPSGNYKYFKILNATDNAAYTGTITINYSNVTYSNYETNCCTALGTINGSFTLSQSSGVLTATLPNASKNANATSYRFTLYNNSNVEITHTDVATGVGDVSTTFSSPNVAAGTTYKVSVTPLVSPQGSFCSTTGTESSKSSITMHYTVTLAVNTAGYGSISPSSTLYVASGTSISASTNTLSVGATNITATYSPQTAQYTYGFTNWTWSPSGSTITANTTATANFSRSARMYDVTTTGITHATASPAIPATVAYGGSISTTITADANYSLPSAITVTGATLDSWNSSTGALSITDVTGDVSITITPTTAMKRIYMNTDGTTSGKWGYDSPKFFVHSWGSSDDDAEMVAQPCASNVFYADIPAANTNLLFTRQDPSAGSSIIYKGNTGNWSQSVDITISTNNYFTFNGNWDVSDGKSGFNAGTYTPDMKTIYLSLCADWLENSPLFALYDVTHSTWMTTFAEVGTGCYAGYYIAQVPSCATTVLIGRFKPGTPAPFGWSGENWWGQSVNFNIGADTYDKITIEGWGDTGEAKDKGYGTLGTFALTQYTVSFAGGGGTGSMSSLTSNDCGSDVALTNVGFSKTGYNFAGWHADVNVKVGGATITAGSIIANQATIQDIRSNVALTAQWTAKQTTVTLNNQSATTAGAASVTATYDAAVPSIAANLPAKTGYTFGGYYTETSGGGTKYINADGSSAKNWDITDATKTLYAKWTAKQTTVTLNNQSATTAGAASVTATYDAAVPSIAANLPAKTGYTFGGYYTAVDGGGTKYINADGSSAKNWDIEDASTTLYAKWTINNYTVTWHVGESTSTSTVAYNTDFQDISVGKPAVTNSSLSSCGSNYFVGWVTSGGIRTTDGGTVSLYNDNKVNATDKITGDIDFYAMFATSSGSAGTVSANLATLKAAVSSISSGYASKTFEMTDGVNSYTITADVTKSTQTDTKDWMQVGRNSDSRKITITDALPGAITNISSTSIYNASASTYSGTIYYNNTASTTDPIASKTLSGASDFSMDVTNGETAGYIILSNPMCLGDLSISYSSVTYSDYRTGCCSLQPVTGLRVSASSANSVTLSWDLPASTAGITKFQVVDVDNSNTVVKDNISTSATNSGSISGLTTCNTYHYAVVSYGSTCTTISDAVTAQPFGSAKTVTFNYNGGTGSPASFTTSCAGNTVALPTPDARTGYTFGGWWSAANGGNSIGAAGASYTVSSNTTIHAHWSQNNYTVTMAQTPSIGATLTGGTTTAHYEGTINISTNVPTGYTFTGWTSSPSVTFANASATSTSFTMPANDVTVTANFSAQTYNITYKDQGNVAYSGNVTAGVPTGAPATHTYGSATALVNGSKTGYTFDGWFTESTCSGDPITSVGASAYSADFTLYAKWTAKPTYTVTLDAGNGSISDVSWTNTSGSVYTKTQANGDASITLPTPSCNCAGWAFQGWSTTSKSNAASFTPDKTDGAEFVPAANVTYYAVYRQSAPSGTTYNKITSTGDLTMGDYIFMSSTGYVMKNAISGTHMDEVSGYTASNSSQTMDNANLVWTIVKFSSQVVIKNGTNYIGVGSDGNITFSTTPHFFTYSYDGVNNRWVFTSVTYPAKQLAYNSYFKIEESQNTAIYLFKQGVALTGNYYTSPVCSDISVTGVASPVAGGTVTLSAASGKTGDKVYAYYTPDDDYNFVNWSISGSGSTLSSTTTLVTEITVGTAATTVTANFTPKVWRTITWKANGTTLTGVGLGEASVKVEDGYNITNLPPTPSSCDAGVGASDQFMGWVVESENWAGKTNDLSEIHIYKRASQFPTVTGNVTYHAVWAASDDTQNAWVKVTDVDDVEAGFKYAVITFDDAYYVGNTDQSTNNPSLNAVTKTSGDINFTNDMEFNATAGPNDGFIFTSAAVSGVKIWGGSANDGVRVSTTSAKAGASDEWFPESNASYGVIMKTSNEKYLSTYSTTDWRNYSSPNASNRAANLYKYAYGHKNYMTMCCDKEVTIGSITKSGSGTVTFVSGGKAVDVGGEVLTCLGATTITATVTPTNGYQCTVLSFTRSDETALTPSPAISVPFTGAQSYDLPFEQNADGVTLNTSVTFVALIDHYIDNMHYNTTQNKSGNYGTVPTLSDESKGAECTGLHYKFIGWIPEGDMNMTTGVPTTTANMVAGGATGKYATGTNYYAIWAEEE